MHQLNQSKSDKKSLLKLIRCPRAPSPEGPGEFFTLLIFEIFNGNSRNCFLLKNSPKKEEAKRE